MARIRIEDLPVNEEMSEQELKGVFGGVLVGLRPPRPGSFGNSRAAMEFGISKEIKVTYNKEPLSSRSVDKEIVNTSLIR